PAGDAEWGPQMQLLNDVLSKSLADEPPMRNRDDDCAWIKAGSILSLHTLTSDEANDEVGKTRLPAPEQMLIAKMSEAETAEMIEGHIEFFSETAHGYRPVHLPTPLVRHFMNRPDRTLPTVSGAPS